MLMVRPALMIALLALAGCGQDDDPAGAEALWNDIHAQKYTTWTRAPGYETRRPTSAPHGDEVAIYVNDVVAKALEGAAISAWPEGSVIVKDGFEGGELDIVAAMEKRADGWFWAEWSADGGSMFSGKPSTCTDCHASGGDFVRAFALPK